MNAMKKEFTFTARSFVRVCFSALHSYIYHNVTFVFGRCHLSRNGLNGSEKRKKCIGGYLRFGRHSVVPFGKFYANFFCECNAHNDNQHTIHWNICHQSHQTKRHFQMFQIHLQSSWIVIYLLALKEETKLRPFLAKLV